MRVMAERSGRVWVTHSPDHQVYAHGRTLRRLRENLLMGLALSGVPTAGLDVEIVVSTPGLEVMREQRREYEEALAEAVVGLHARRVSLADMATAVGVPRPQVKRILAEVQLRRESVDSAPEEAVSSVELVPADVGTDDD